MSHIGDVVKQLEAQKAAIDKALAALREVDGNGEPSSSESVGSEPAPVAANASDRRSAGQKARWVAKRAAEAAAPATRKGGMTPDGRKRLAEAMKRRWAVKRAAAQAKKKAGRPNKAA